MKPETFGSYTLIRQLGRGGMAEVFLARARSVGGFEKLVAIKRLLGPFNSDPQVVSMLADEARLSVWLTHPNIVQVLDFGKVGKTHYIAMEYVEGCDLCDLVRPHGKSPGRPLPLPTALFVMIQVAEALDYAHRRCNSKGEHLKVIHRDVSPHNVLISTEGQVKLADFGLARATISLHKSFAGVIRGKFSYMPKEQAHGRDIDHRIDIFAAGVTLFEALTGVKPYTSTTLPQQLYQLEQPVPPPSAHIFDIPEEIDDLTLQTLSPDPDTRYQSAHDLANDLRTALNKISSFGQEEKQLTALVKSAVMEKPGAALSLPHMSLADIPITKDNLIGEEVLAVRQIQYPEVAKFVQEPSSTADLPPLDPAGIGDDGEDDDSVATSEFRQAQSPDTDEIESSKSLEELDPHDTIRDPGHAGQLARRAIQQAGVISTGPAAPLRKKEPAVATPSRRPSVWHWLGVLAAGLILIGLGIAMGWFLHGSELRMNIPAAINKVCPEPRPCPECPQPIPGGSSDSGPAKTKDSTTKDSMSEKDSISDMTP